MSKLLPQLRNVFCIILLFFSLNGLNASANQPVTSSDLLGKNTVLKIGVSSLNHYPSFNFQSPTDKGVSWAILQAFAKQYNYSFEYIVLPPVRLQTALESGAIDFVYPDHPSWTAHKPVKDNNIYSKAIVEAISATFVDSFNQEILLSEVTSVSIPFGYSAATWMTPIEEYGIYSMPARDLEMALHSVKTGTATAADVEYNAGQYIISNNPSLSSLVINKNLPNSRVTYHLSTQKHVLVLEQISQFSMENTQLIKDLKEKYGLQKHQDIYTSVNE
ncbi:hypothetical protein [Glaciecola sp. SC05]|uniref:hypothetical protein n=1 Tax=Glaciecola sp. SC05 TaxID=1987355 RepID=UPI003528455D